MTTLLIDLGNTALKWTTPEEADTPHTVVHQGSTQGKDELYRNWLALRPSRVIGCNVASPTLAFSATKFFNDHGIPWEWVRSESTHRAVGFTLTNAYERTGQLGPDRWYASIGALSLFRGTPLLVVHAGTATTVDSVFMTGLGEYRFMGGRIAPGPALMHKALLSAVPTLDSSLTEHKDFPLCSSDAITTGIIDAQVGLIAQAYESMCEAGQRPKIILAGGSSRFLAPRLRTLHPTLIVRHNLVLGGLAQKARESKR